MKLMKEMHKKEGGQALVLALVLMLFGSLTIPPVLSHISTGLWTGKVVYEEETKLLYAADAGVEDAINKIVSDYAALPSGEGGSYSYTLTSPVNGVSPINVTVTKLSMLQGVLGKDEFKGGRPHDDWITLGAPQVTVNEGEGWVEYTCPISFYYDGTGNRQLESAGAFFSPFPGADLVEGPYGWQGTELGVITFTKLEAGSPEYKVVTGGFVFIWRWLSNEGPTFDNNPKDPRNSGAFSFKFKVYSLDWERTLSFIFSTFKQQDISYVTNAPGSYKWVIEATAGDTWVRSAIVETAGVVVILTWEINPPQ